MSRVFEVLVDERSKTRITVANERTTVKIPDRYSTDTRERIVEFAKGIENMLREKYTVTVRGAFNRNFSSVYFSDKTGNIGFSVPTGMYIEEEQ
jgi:hypothetical protein